MTAPILLCLVVILAGLIWAARETFDAWRQSRPARFVVVLPSALVVAGGAVVALLYGLKLRGLLGVDRGFVGYPAAPPSNHLFLLPIVGIALLVLAAIGALRVARNSSGEDLSDARTRNRLAAAGGAVLVVVGAVAIALG